MTGWILWYVYFGLMVAWVAFMAVGDTDLTRGLTRGQACGILFLIAVLWPLAILFGLYKLIRLGIQGLRVLSKENEHG